MAGIRTFIHAANGHGGWEAALSNVLSRGETVLVLESGLFALGWGDMARMMRVKTEILKGDERRAVDARAIRQRLEADITREIKAVLVVQIETASGVVDDIKAIREAIAAARHPALLMVDCVASLACMPFDMDGWGVDVAMAGSQKGLMTPPGLARVAANDRAQAVHQNADLRTRYWDWTFRQGDSTGARHPSISSSAWDSLSTCCWPRAWIARPTATRCSPRPRARPWGAGTQGGALAFNVTHAAERVHSVTCILTPGRHPRPLLDYCRDKCGVVLGVGIGNLSGKGFRIAWATSTRP